jgi:hypothetical protein
MKNEETINKKGKYIIKIKNETLANELKSSS